MRLKLGFQHAELEAEVIGFYLMPLYFIFIRETCKSDAEKSNKIRHDHIPVHEKACRFPSEKSVYGIPHRKFREYPGYCNVIIGGKKNEAYQGDQYQP